MTMDRSHGIGGSDVGALFGLDKWHSLPKLWLEKTGQLLRHEAESEPQEWGRDFEDCVARRFAKRTGRRVQRIKKEIRHNEYPFMRGHPDRFQWDNTRPKKSQRGVLEVKCTNWGNLKVWVASGIPAQYYLQLQHYLVLTKSQWGSFAVLFGGNRLMQFDVERDEKLIPVMLERERDFWTLVETRTPPPITLTSEWNEYLAAYFPQPKQPIEQTITTPEAVDRARRYLRVRAQIAQRAQAMQAHEVFFKQAMADCERLLVPGVARFSWVASERTSIDVQGMRERLPDLARQFERRTPTRRFTCTALGDVNPDDDEAEDEPTIQPSGARRIVLE